LEHHDLACPKAFGGVAFCTFLSVALKSLLFNRQELCEVDCEWRAEKLCRQDCINSKLTAQEVEEALEVFPFGADHDVAN
jgi:hypothetical protein